MRVLSLRFLIVSLCGFIALVSAARAEGPGYHLLKEIQIGGEGGWDCLSVDETNRRLYVSHATRVVVIDLATDTVAGEVTDTPGIHDFASAPALGRGFSSNGKENKVSIVDLKTLQTLSKVDTGENPDVIRFEPARGEVYAFNGRGNSITVIAAATGTVAATIPLPGKPEFAAADTAAGRLYCNLEDKSSVAVIDTAKHTVLTTWPIAPGQSASGLALDPAQHRLFLGCDNHLMVMMDSESGKVLGSVPIGGRIDGTVFDPGTQLAFSASGEGTVTIAHEDSPDTLTTVQTLATAPGARTIALDPQTHRIYLPTAQLEPAPGGGRPHPIAGSFKILVFGPQ